MTGTAKVNVAVKTVNKNVDAEFGDDLINEINILLRVGEHPNVLTLIGACTQNVNRSKSFEYATHMMF